MNKYQELAKKYPPCIVVCPRKEFINGSYVTYGLTVLAESAPGVGHSHGVNCRYDYGFMQLDVEASINVFVINN